MAQEQTNYIYVVIRRDLSFAQQAVQAAHAVIEATRQYIKPDDTHPHLVILTVADEERLNRVVYRLQDNSIPFQTFIEPDIGDQLTAIATAPVCGDNRRLFRKYALLTGEIKQ